MKNSTKPAEKETVLLSQTTFAESLMKNKLKFKFQTQPNQGQLICSTLLPSFSMDNVLKILSLVLIITLNSAIKIAAQNTKLDSIINLVMNTGAQYLEDGDFEKARYYADSAVSLAQKTYGENHPFVWYKKVVYGFIAMESGDFETAQSIFLAAKPVIEQSYGKLSAEYTSTLNNLACLYHYKGDFSTSEPYYLELISLEDSCNNCDKKRFGVFRSNLAFMYQKMNRLKESETFFLSAIHRDSIHGQTGTISFATHMNNFGILYEKMGLYKKAESCHLTALKIRKEKLPRDHPHYGSSLNNLGVIYMQISDYKSAEIYFEECKDIYQKSYGESHFNYGIVLHNLGLIKYYLNDYPKSIEYITEAIEVYKKSIGYNHYYSLSARIGLANSAKALGNIVMADSLTNSCLIFIADKYGTSEPLYLSALISKAGILLTDKKYFEALDTFDVIIKTSNSVFGGMANTMIPAMEKSLKISRLLNNSSAITENYINLNNALRYRIKYLSSFLTEKQLGSFILRSSEMHDELGSINYQLAYKNESSIFPTLYYDHLLFWKGLLLEESMLRQNSQYFSSPEIKSAYDSLAYYKSELSKLLSLPVSKRLNFDHLQQKSDEFEKQVLGRSKEYSDMTKKSMINLTSICGNIPEYGTSIEFTHFNFTTPYSADSIFYGALVLFPQDTTPCFIPLFEEKQLTALLEKTGDQAQATTNLYAATRSGDLLGQAPSYGTELYKLIWKPLDSLLQAHQIKKVYFSPSGLLHRVAFAALPIDGKNVLADRYELHQLGSTRSLVVKTPEPVAQDYTAAIFGGVQYDRSGTQTDSTAPEITDNRLWTLIERPRSGVEDGFDYLPGTDQEAQRLEKTFTQNSIVTRSHTGAKATEEALKYLGRDTMKSPDILHIATHGFFFPDPEKRKSQSFGEENAFKWNENPLFRSGLALSGANATWSGQPTPGSIEDGIATAYEISHLNLSNTKLVVLSACETGLGDIKGSEGVYGLQRAFKMAGADFLLVSLWQVPDKETVEFMDAFYGAWLKGKTIHEAFAKAQKKMRKKYKEVYKWGAWVLVE